MPSSRSFLPRVVTRAALLPVVCLALHPPTAVGAERPDTQTSATSADPAATHPATGPTEQQIAEAAVQLGSPDYRTRENATKFLWSAGRAAEAALRAAAQSADPEVALRARKVLADFEYGLTPDTPREVMDLVARYRTGDAPVKHAAVAGLSNQGVRGVRVLLKLWAAERGREPALHAAIGAALAQRARDTAALLLAEGERDLAGRLLEVASREGHDADAPRHYAAFLLLTDGLEAKVAALEAGEGAGDVGHAIYSRRLLAHLYRAKGDLGAALSAARRVSDEDLIHGLLVESGDWAELAREAERRVKVIARGDRGGLGERYAYLATFHRLAGDSAACDRWLDKLAAHAEASGSSAWPAAEALMLNGRVPAGVELLLRQRDFATAADFMAPLLRLTEGMNLPERAAAAGTAAWDLPVLKIKAARAARFAHGPARAAELMEAVAKENRATGDRPNVHAALVKAARVTLPAEQLDRYLLAALEAAREKGAAEALLREAGVGERATAWWPVLRERFPREPLARTLGRVRAMDRKQLPADELHRLARDAAAAAVKLPSAERDARLGLVVDTLLAAGHAGAAEMVLKMEADLTPTTAGFIRHGDLAAARKEWDRAAGQYEKAWERDRSQPLPLLLRGRALIESGKADEGRAMVELAHLLPLADGSARHALMLALAERGLADDARRERDLIRQTAALSSWELSDATRRAGDEANGKGDWRVAAGLWERAFLDNLNASTGFVEPWANLAMPALISRTRALALIQAGDVPGAMKQADVCLASFPAEADHLIALVTALDKAGHRAEADDLFARWTGVYRGVLKDFPDSGPAHNMLAWAQAKCGRELDDALAHARRAVELEPDHTASLDTLAETHFRRGETAQAIETMARCVELEPDDKRHREKLEQFRAAAGAPERTKEPD